MSIELTTHFTSIVVKSTFAARLSDRFGTPEHIGTVGGALTVVLTLNNGDASVMAVLDDYGVLSSAVKEDIVKKALRELRSEFNTQLRHAADCYIDPGRASEIDQPDDEQLEVPSVTTAMEVVKACADARAARILDNAAKGYHIDDTTDDRHGDGIPS